MGQLDLDQLDTTELEPALHEVTDGTVSRRRKQKSGIQFKGKTNKELKMNIRRAQTSGQSADTFSRHDLAEAGDHTLRIETKPMFELTENTRRHNSKFEIFSSFWLNSIAC
jgi:hypothetical protein